MTRRPIVAALAALLLPPLAAVSTAPAAVSSRRPAAAAEAPSTLAGWDLVSGRVHNHTGYSDGVGTPQEAFRTAKEAGFGFFTVTEHSNLLTFPFAFTDDCAEEPDPLGCWTKTPLPERTEWEDIRVRAAEASDASFVGIRGFEWSSDHQGHIGVLFSSNYYGEFVNAGDEGVYPGPLSNTEITMDGFWRWFLTEVSSGGGADGLAVFNHPGREGDAYDGERCAPSGEPSNVFESFRHVPEADPRVVGVEVFNRGRGGDARYEDCFRLALSRGWHVGAVGASDEHGPRWDRPDRASTVLLVEPGAPLTLETAREAFRARRFSATRDPALDVVLTAGSAPMGSRLDRPAGSPVSLTVLVRGGDPELAAELVGWDGSVREATLAPTPADPEAGSASWSVTTPAEGEGWWYVRLVSGDGTEAVTSPVWIAAGG